MITEIEDYFDKGCGRCPRFDTPDCSTKLWDKGERDLRRICKDMGLEETVKWAHPCYMHAGRNISVMGAFRTDFRLSFFNGGLMKDPEELLEKAGENSAGKSVMRFTGNDQPARMEGTIRAYLREAMDYAERGIVAERDTSMPDLPAELVDALDGDAELSEAFHALTPGRQKSYIINLNGAKKPETRVARIEKFRDKIIAGKGALER